jgi:hypothetical protein
MRPIGGPLRTVLDTVDLRLQEAPSRAELQKRIAATSGYERRYAEQLIEALDATGKLPSSYPYPVQIWRFGDSLTFISLGGEVVVDYALRLKGKYGWENTWVSGYNNDVFAYIPTARIVREGGYEGATSMISCGLPAPFTGSIEETIAAKVDELITRLK